jgi:hypothetical protein
MVSSFLALSILGAVHAESIQQAYPLPMGTQEVAGDAFGQWLKSLELRPEGTAIRTHSGHRVHHDGRPIELPLVRGDLQQCADSAIRLRAEWIRQTGGDLQNLSFHATSGDPLPWSRFRDGEKPYAKGNRIHWRPVERANQSWEAWLSSVFMWAGTRSLWAYETQPVEGSPKPGHLLVTPGSPGHAVVVLRVAEDRENRRTYMLVGEGFMPAQDFHVEHGPHDGWWEWGSQGLRLAHWHMGQDTLRRWR